ncbi:hypothetical protein C8R32_10998 [Nitrosospira sp. Nsp5]|uniref:Uncharacterized protein n=1 Tax=Nitrosospira multiformis TaxID=1231 RepID=A0ABY0TIG4_9PROT|nr:MULTISPECIES: hypothetical protein [Nitrosospira]PTR06812.1 hypothetical protein C8R32_10998 [Nitrosospira sp. Nsp5]SDQ88870.1 hypothetical protein SAMN05216402_2696 [Nitrosospira multiformis]
MKYLVFFIALNFSVVNVIAWAAGPDVVVNKVDDVQESGSRDAQGRIGITASTDSCNLGTQALEWKGTPSTQHPVISLNLYRLHNNKMQQLGMSWVKHGFFATNASHCAGIPGAPSRCDAPSGHDGQKLYPGCTDLYPAALNANEELLGPRSKINPTTGMFDETAQDLTGYPPSKGIEKIILLEEEQLQMAGARYFIESQYIAVDDAAAGNAQNNLSYREVIPTLSGNRYSLNKKNDDIEHLKPAISEWQKDGAKIEIVTTQETNQAKSYIYVASKSLPLANGTYRYEYAVFNMNSDIGVQGLEVPANGIVTGSVGFYAPKYHGEIYSSDPWRNLSEAGIVSWQTKKSYSEDKNANAIRWGTTYNFWFESTNPPEIRESKISRFKPIKVEGVNKTFSVDVIAPR